MWTVIETPIGPLRLVADAALTAIEFSPFADRPGIGERRDEDPVLASATTQLAEYFAGTRTEFDLPLAPNGTKFQLQVWDELQKIGYGHTATYGEIAARLGATNTASRAVGAANARNPLPIVIPCHRVIGADGSLTGYAGGLARKQQLLALERPALLA